MVPARASDVLVRLLQPAPTKLDATIRDLEHAYDVLAKPFDHAEVVRTISLAWLRWTKQPQGLPPETHLMPSETQLMKAAG